MRSISYALALVGALGLFVACGDSSGDDAATPTVPATDDADAPADNVMKGPDVDAMKRDTAMPDVPADAGAAVADLQTVTLDITGMT